MSEISDSDANAGNSKPRLGYQGEPRAPNQKEVVNQYFKPALQLGFWLIWPLIAIARFLHKYDGVITGLATAAIAWLTLELATYASHQEDILNHQIRDAEIAQRALVFLDGFDANLFEGTLSISPKWRNSGTTPTRFMTNYVSWTTFLGDPPEDFNFPDLGPGGVIVTAETRKLQPAFVGPSSATHAQAAVFPLADLEHIRQQRSHILIWGWARYSDSFGTKHISRFANQVILSWPEGQKTGGPTINLYYPVYKKYNCTDEECAQQGIP